MPLTPEQQLKIIQLGLQKKQNELIKEQNDKELPPPSVHEVIQNVGGTQAVIIKVEGEVESITGNPGQDGEPAPAVDEEALAQRVLEMIPPPEPGKDADEDAIVKRVVALIPKPKPGKDADETKIVKTVLSKLPKIKDGITPKKGEDYLTDDEVDELLAKFKKEVEPTPESTRDLLHSLEKGNRLHIDYIDGVEEFKKTLSTGNTIIGGARMLSNLSDVNVYEITNGQSIKWDDTTGKFIAYTPSGSGDMLLDTVQTVTAAKTFNTNTFKIAGATSGSTILNATAVAGSGTVTFPTTGTLATLDGVEVFTGKSIVATQLTGTTYTMAVNNTSGTAAYTLTTFKQPGLTTYAGTIDFDGTDPTSPILQEYTLSQSGKDVRVQFVAEFTNAGVNNTLAIIPLPSDCPAPLVIGGAGDAADEVIVPCNGFYLATKTSQPPTSQRAWLSRNTANDGYAVNIKGSAASVKFVTFKLDYTAA